MPRQRLRFSRANDTSLVARGKRRAEIGCPESVPRRGTSLAMRLCETDLQKENRMSTESNKAQGHVEELGGKIAAGFGKLIGNKEMQAEGEAKELEGKARVQAAKAAERTKGKVEEAVGAVKNRVGAVIDNDEMEVEGAAKKLEGQARQKANE
jgi:uncharacterized protein YjbJ (UPF0337 family)